MVVALFLASIGVFLASGIASCPFGSRPPGRGAAVSRAIASLGALSGSLLALASGLQVLIEGRPQALTLPWSLPFGSLALEIDALSAFFLLPVSIVTGLAAVYAVPYRRLHDRRGTGAFQGLWYNVLAIGMLLVLAARNGLLFLLSWEMMSLASFFLVMTHGEEESTRQAGWTYLVATHLGTAFLLVLFLLLGRGGGSLDFSAFSTSGAPAGLLFLLALVGFGTKAGFVPLHVWLPEAHPAAPSPVSAVMSGVMIKTGIYGLLRALTFLGSPPSWWGWTLLIVGAASGLLGVLHALAQHDLKRLLAYHSVENIGIIALGLGLGLLGVSHRLPLLAALGLAGGLLHVLNHALFKSLLFLGAGAVDCAAGTREMDRLGGLLKKMPVTGVGFLIGSAAISGLPPLNGFVSEFLIYLGAGRGLLLEGAASPAPTVAGLAVIGSLALIGGLAAACFAKAFGIVFLGEPRRPSVLPTGEVPRGMRLPMVLLAALCLAGGLLAPLALQAVRPAVILLAGPGSGAAELESGLAGAASALSAVVRLSVLLLALLLGIALLRRLALSGKEVRTEVTWDCGYAAPTPRMQYTASSFAGSITGSFQLLLHSGRRIHPPQGYFPAPASLHIEPRDPFLRGLFRPLFRAVSWAAIRLRWLQQGSIQLYILYIALTILVLLVWKLE